MRKKEVLVVSDRPLHHKAIRAYWEGGHQGLQREPDPPPNRSQGTGGSAGAPGGGGGGNGPSDPSEDEGLNGDKGC